jgi:hypothetical protein
VARCWRVTTKARSDLFLAESLALPCSFFTVSLHPLRMIPRLLSSDPLATTVRIVLLVLVVSAASLATFATTPAAPVDKRVTVSP